MIVSCGGCKKRYNVDESMVARKARLRCTGCGNIFIAEDRAGSSSVPKVYKVLVANGEESVCDRAEELLKCEMIDVAKVYSGTETLDTVMSFRPDAMVLDVALPGIYGVVICERVKKHPELKDTKVILVASIYKESRFRRKPTTLYGADYCIEKHNLDDELMDVVCRSLGVQRPIIGGCGSTDANVSVEIPQRADKKGKEGLHGVGGASMVEDAVVHERATRLARIIVADIMLYHRKKMDFNIKTESIFEVFKSEIEEGIKYFEKKIPGVSSKEYIIKAFREVLTSKKNLSAPEYGMAAGDE